MQDAAAPGYTKQARFPADLFSIRGEGVFSGVTQRGLIVIDQVAVSSADSEISCLSSLLFAK